MNTHRKRNSQNAVVPVVLAALALLTSFGCRPAAAQTPTFHDAPATAAKTKNPFAGQADAAQAGANLYAKKCVLCHGDKGQGVGNIPALAKGPTQAASDGAIFWFITQGDPIQCCQGIARR